MLVSKFAATTPRDGKCLGGRRQLHRRPGPVNAGANLAVTAGRSKSSRRRLAEDLYFRIVAVARQPVFYQEFAVPDTVNGRFDMIILLTALIVRRLRRDAQAVGAQELAFGLFDVLFADMDRSLRELGVGDIRIGKKVKAMAKAYYGRSKAYDDALDGKEPLAAALARNLYGDPQAGRAPAQAMAPYIQQAMTVLDQNPLKDLMAGDPGLFAPTDPGASP